MATDLGHDVEIAVSDGQSPEFPGTLLTGGAAVDRHRH